VRATILPVGVGLLAAFSATTPAVAGAQIPSLEKLLACNLAARGGDRWKAVETLRLVGRITADGRESRLTVLARRPNLRRQEIAFEAGTVITSFDGEEAWTLDPFLGESGAREVTGRALEQARRQADFDGPLIDHAAKGYAAELVGPVTVNGRAANRVKITANDGTVEYFDLDAETCLEVRITTDRDGSGTLESELTDYRWVDGILAPFRVVTRAGGRQVSELVVDRLELDVPIDAAVFRMPGR
jgi:outer membrane lipoprotein-sorting protein